ncbi:hypothetical protein HDU92_002254, partial [Lobulomyces angularis]
MHSILSININYQTEPMTEYLSTPIQSYAGQDVCMGYFPTDDLISQCVLSPTPNSPLSTISSLSDISTSPFDDFDLSDGNLGIQLDIDINSSQYFRSNSNSLHVDSFNSPSTTQQSLINSPSFNFISNIPETTIPNVNPKQILQPAITTKKSSKSKFESPKLVSQPIILNSPLPETTVFNDLSQDFTVPNFQNQVPSISSQEQVVASPTIISNTPYQFQQLLSPVESSPSSTYPNNNNNSLVDDTKSFMEILPTNFSAPSVSSSTSSKDDLVKEYPCPHCPRVFPKTYNLKSHLQCHSGVKPHKCSAPGCESSFTRKH